MHRTPTSPFWPYHERYDNGNHVVHYAHYSAGARCNDDIFVHGIIPTGVPRKSTCPVTCFWCLAGIEWPW